MVKSLVADVVLSAIGLQPSISLAKEGDIQTSRGILTNAQLETNQATYLRRRRLC